MSTTQRLLAAADWTAHLPEPVPMPNLEVKQYKETVDVTWHLATADDSRDQRTLTAEIRRSIGGEWTKGSTGNSFWLSHERVIGGVAFDFTIYCDREQVCRRVVTGTEEVTVPAVEAQPERVEEVEVVEWQCDPIVPESDLTERSAS